MENIEIYLKAAELYGVSVTGLFPTVDLYENRNLGTVIAGLQQLGSEVGGATCLPTSLQKSVSYRVPLKRGCWRALRYQLTVDDGMFSFS
mgnify:FL=1